LVLWLVGWTYGEVFALRELGEMIAAASGHPSVHGMHAPPAAFGVAASAFLTLWVALWTFAGVMTARQAFAVGWGTDVFVLRPDGGTWRRGRATAPRTPPPL